MNEDFLHYVWKYQLFSNQNLKVTNKGVLNVLKTGLHNYNAGPDFLNAHVKINNQLWVGNVEIHLKSSDWYVHHHEVDENYDAVILHVVWEDDVTVFMKNNKPIPTLVLKDIVLKSALKNFRNLFSTEQRWIPCEEEIKTIDSFSFENWKERLFFERLERKSEEMKVLLKENKNDFESTLFHLLAKNFGLKINGDAFLKMATSFDFSVLRKTRFDKNQLAALFFGQSGFLDGHIEDTYYLNLKEEFAFLKHKYQLIPISKNSFSFFRMRPNNFPTIRIAQLVAVYYEYQSLFSKILNINNIDELYILFNVEVHPFWQTHYNFGKESKTSPKKMTKTFIDLLIINTILPLKFLYKKNRGVIKEIEFLGIFKEIKPEKNNIISKFTELEVVSKNSYETQALLELKNNYCAKKQCLQCAIGRVVLGK